MTDSERSTRARLAALARARKYDAKELTAAATAASHGLERFESLVDPKGELSPAERRRRAEIARKEHYIRIGRLGGKARKKKAS